ncbi:MULTISPECIES: EAL domain-containing protein [Vibrio]|nr:MULTISPECIES: EAL domain-containing protein [Vibrio]EKO3829400.1 EAL domain-containing protein [Vibrio harveyi]EKO3834295.1 EAL domain-containing protein [Vibrio harveyi]EKO3857188.1 EAL domain-containing protein [Vibrio harveyi]EKO3860840.1 EAL domain-containing protein [Vibrio harveyi]EKO3866417.1 EAL domain-containing protein [Vibrio harveyi]
MTIKIEEISIDNNIVSVFWNNQNFVSLEFKLQPIVDPKNYKIHGYEVLSHLVNSSGERLNSEEFFEYINDEFIKKIFLCQIRFLNDNLSQFNLNISLNLPLSCLLDSSFVDEVIENTENPIIIEVTKIESIKEVNAAKRNIVKLKKQGHQFWLDDYHHDEKLKTSALQCIDWDAIKLDKSYLLYQDGLTMIGMLIPLLKFHSKKIIVEGVETSSQRVAFLHPEVFHQGYNYYYPLSLSETLDLLNFREIKETHRFETVLSA